MRRLQADMAKQRDFKEREEGGNEIAWIDDVTCMQRPEFHLLFAIIASSISHDSTLRLLSTLRIPVRLGSWVGVHLQPTC